jgi:hypothetical protein
MLIQIDPLELNFRGVSRAQRSTKVMRCRTGIVSVSEFLTIPDQRCIAIALHRVREKMTKAL